MSDGTIPEVRLRACSGTALRARIENAEDNRTRLIDEMIAAGRGREVPSETFTKDDQLSQRYTRNSNYLRQLTAERARRLTYHGKLSPIKEAL